MVSSCSALHNTSASGLFDRNVSRCIYKCAFAVLLMLGTMRVSQAAPGPFGADGWYTWRVAAIDDAPSWCCMTWSGGNARSSACNLDDRQYGFGGMDHGFEPIGEMQLYVKMQGGELARIRTLSPQCPIESPGDSTDFGSVDNDESLAWLGEHVGGASRISEDALTAIATHDGDDAVRMLVETAESAERHETRKNAIFWMSQLRIAETNEDVQRFMFEDDSTDIRKHAAFALAESVSPDRIEALTRQGREDSSSDVRSEAWFWLAQTELLGVEDVIRDAITADPSRKVREEAVFALSQLPADRAVDSLLSIVRDTDMPQPIREKALFWLVESDHDAAFEEIERLLSSRE